MNNVQNNNEILDEVTVESELVTKTALYGSKKNGRVTAFKKRQRKANNIIFKASKALKILDKDKFKKVIHLFRTTDGEAKITAAKMIIKSASKQAA